jgi:DnaK suppressor protein
MVSRTRTLPPNLVRELGRSLHEARRRLLRTAGMTEEELGSLGGPEVGAPIEDAARAEIQAILGRLEDHEQREFDEIEAALERLHAGTLGRCERCGGEIPLERLRAIPTARRCLACQHVEEEGR